MKFDYLIVGGGIAGITAAEIIRTKDAAGSLVVVTDEPYPLYSRVMLSKPSFLAQAAPADRIWLKPADWYEKNNITLMTGKSATGLDTVKKTVTLSDGTSPEFGKLLIAAGVHARIWTVPGADKDGVFYLRTLDQAKKIAEAMKTKRRAVVIGSSCVSFEAIENLRAAGIEVAVVMLEKYFWEPMLDEEGGRIVEQALAGAGAKICRQSEVREVLGGAAVEGVILKDGTKIDCDMIVAGIGVVLPVDWVKAAGVAVGHGIIANEYMETSVLGIWTAGDIAEFNDVVLKETHAAGNWMSAREGGRVAGANMAGGREIFKLVSFYTSRAFGVNVAFGGDIRVLDDRRVVSRGDAVTGAHARIILKDNAIAGVAMVNRMNELGTIVKLIEAGTNVSAKEKELADPGFDLKQLTL